MENSSWRCPRCGPVRDPLFGEDEKFHCSSVGCDRVVSILSRAEKRSTSKFTKSPGRPPKRSLDEAASIAHGRAVLARMRRRNRDRALRRKGMAKPKNSRYGTCSDCGRGNVWLLTKDPYLCRACHQARKTDGEVPKPKKPEKAERSSRRKPCRGSGGDDIGREVAAIEACMRAIADLEPDEAQRAVGYAVHRYAQKRGLDVQGSPLLLTGPTE